jgi:alpha-methylacyl-CoA racemase
MTGMYQSMLASGMWAAPRGGNLFDGGAPFYRCYRTSDDRWMAVGAIEPEFFGRVLEVLGLEPGLAASQLDPQTWPAVSRRFEERFAERSRDQWCEAFAGADACVAPVLSAREALADPHLAARGTYAAGPGGRFDPVSPGVAPRFSRTPGKVGWPAGVPGRHTEEVLAELGIGR